MIIYKPDNKVFNSRKEAKEYLGSYNFNKMMKTNDERLIVIKNEFIAGYESINKDANFTEESNQ